MNLGKLPFELLRLAHVAAGKLGPKRLDLPKMLGSLGAELLGDAPALRLGAGAVGRQAFALLGQLGKSRFDLLAERRHVVDVGLMLLLGSGEGLLVVVEFGLGFVDLGPPLLELLVALAELLLAAFDVRGKGLVVFEGLLTRCLPVGLPGLELLFELLKLLGPAIQVAGTFFDLLPRLGRLRAISFELFADSLGLLRKRDPCLFDALAVGRQKLLDPAALFAQRLREAFRTAFGRRFG